MTRILSAVVTVLFVLGLPAAHAQPEEAGTLAKLWVIQPKAEMAESFEAAFAKHVEWRRDNSDPWHWNVYVVVDGQNAGTYYARSAGHHYRDFDHYIEFQQRASDHWQKSVAKYVAKSGSMISRELPDMSQWEGNTSDYNLFWVYSSDIKPGQMQSWKEAAGMITNELAEADWPYEWFFVERLSGGTVPSVALVIPAANWAGMEDPDPSAFDAVAARHDQAKAAKMWQDYYAPMKTTSSYVLRRIPDFEVKAAQ